MQIIKPQHLKKGDTIGLLSISGVLDKDAQLKLFAAKEYFEQKGYKVKISETSFGKEDYICDTKENRIKALKEFFEDKTINTIIATRGGYGVLQIIDDIDYNVIKNNPKNFVGYSDISALLWKIFQKTGLITFHGPMACSDFGINIDNFTKISFFNILKGTYSQIKIMPLHSNSDNYRITATICPMNLATLTSLSNMDFDISTNIILLLEDINEPVYKIDKMITSLFRNDFFQQNVKAIVLGDFGELDNIEYFRNFWKRFYIQTQIPIFYGAKFGHIKQKLTIPFGMLAELNNNTLTPITQEYC